MLREMEASFVVQLLQSPRWTMWKPEQWVIRLIQERKKPSWWLWWAGCRSEFIVQSSSVYDEFQRVYADSAWCEAVKVDCLPEIQAPPQCCKRLLHRLSKCERDLAGCSQGRTELLIRVLYIGTSAISGSEPCQLVETLGQRG